MRRLILIRHAKSSWDDPKLGDHERALNKRGRRGADLIGEWLRSNGYRPDRALVSDATRTRETWDRIAEAAASAAPVEHLAALYHASPDAHMACLRAAPDVVTVAMVAHQPGIGAFAHALLAEPPDTAEFLKYPTTATAVIDFDADAWRGVAWQTGRLVDFVVPRALE